MGFWEVNKKYAIVKADDTFLKVRVTSFDIDNNLIYVIDDKNVKRQLNITTLKEAREIGKGEGYGKTNNQ